MSDVNSRDRRVDRSGQVANMLSAVVRNQPAETRGVPRAARKILTFASFNPPSTVKPVSPSKELLAIFEP